MSGEKHTATGLLVRIFFNRMLSECTSSLQCYETLESRSRHNRILSVERARHGLRTEETVSNASSCSVKRQCSQIRALQRSPT